MHKVLRAIFQMKQNKLKIVGYYFTKKLLICSNIIELLLLYIAVQYIVDLDDQLWENPKE